jgi:hypothetical protein
MSEISFSGQWDERTSTALVAFHYVARRTNTDDRLEGSSVGLFQARCLSGRENPELGGFWEEPFVAPTQRQEASPFNSS